MSTTAYERLRDALESHGSLVKDNGHGKIAAQCPAHPDNNPSLSVTAIEGSVLLYCHAGCQTEDVLAALELTKGDLFDNPKGAEYVYPGGRIVTRTPDKQFRQKVPDGGDRSLFHGDRIGDAMHVLVVEGEKDVLAAEAVGAVAVCAAMGAGKAHLFDWEPLRGKHVTVVPDKDKPGGMHAEQVAERLRAVDVASVRIAHAAVGKDLADHVAAWHPLEELVAEEAADSFTFVDGGTFIFDQPSTTPAVWGSGTEVLWAEGEALMIAGPQGVGKTTLAGQLVRARLGLGDGLVLGQPVAQTGGVILYLAMDRPRQAARSMLRQFRPDERAIVSARLVIWRGPPPADIAKNPGLLLKLARQTGADMVIIDSLKDAALGLVNDEVGAGYNWARQGLVEAGIELLELHHNVKRTADGGTPTVADIYGSGWITAGLGSIVMLNGAPGDPIVSFRHIKQPAEEVGPYRLSHDQAAGVLTIDHEVDLVALAKAGGADGITAKGAAMAITETEAPSKADVEKARRRLEKLVDPGGLLVRLEGARGGGSDRTPTAYFPPGVEEVDHAAITQITKPQVEQSWTLPITEPITHPVTPITETVKPQVEQSRTPHARSPEPSITQPTVSLETGVRVIGDLESTEEQPVSPVHCQHCGVRLAAYRTEQIKRRCCSKAGCIAASEAVSV